MHYPAAAARAGCTSAVKSSISARVMAPTTNLNHPIFATRARLALSD
jgi:hypothetical protein